VYFVFKPENFVKTDGFFVYSKIFCRISHNVPLITICFVKKCSRNETPSYSFV